MTDRSLKALAAAPFLAIVSALPVMAADAATEVPKVSDPVTHANLSIYFVKGPSDPGPVPLTLDEALEKGSVRVHETQQVSELEIENTGESAVFVHAGDIVKGGQQDRVLTVTILVPPKSGRVPIASFCVERGRWTARGSEEVATFASSKAFMPSLEGKRAMRTAQKAEALAALAADPSTTGSTAAGVEAGVAASEPAAQAAVPESGELPLPEGEPRGVRTMTLDGQGEIVSPAAPDAQSEVWRNVDAMQSALGMSLSANVTAAASPSSLQLALENEKLAKAQAEYVGALQPKGEQGGDIVGLVIAVNGTVKSADVYPSNALFRKFWAKHLNAAATEAIARRDDTSAIVPEPAKADVEAFLADARNGVRADQPLSEALELEISEGKQAESFASRLKDGKLLHLNVLAK
ncbi:MAG: DUF6569 family protein [Hyphomicrobium sp.]|uniref:ARPP-1 family domain-containing protein n=1 Tax=Hyphomicrobium sp. TaxID=82 RepID=UPI003D0FF4EA